jgi:uncharacterized protein YndB with AHSA1/START domain
MTEQGERGVVIEGPQEVRLEFRRSWHQPVEDVWSALTEPDRMNRWLGVYDGERRPGGSGMFTMTQEAELVGEPMRIIECQPPHRLVVEWAGEQKWRVQVDLSTEDGRAVLRFGQAFPPGTDVSDVATGWQWYLDKLDAEITGSPQPPDWDAFLAAAGPAYGLPPEA